MLAWEVSLEYVALTDDGWAGRSLYPLASSKVIYGFRSGCMVQERFSTV